MPETRYVEEYENGQLVNKIPYEVSDEELAKEAEQATCEEYLKYSSQNITQPEMWFLLRVFGKALGYKVDGEIKT